MYRSSQSPEGRLLSTALWLSKLYMGKLVLCNNIKLFVDIVCRYAMQVPIAVCCNFAGSYSAWSSTWREKHVANTLCRALAFCLFKFWLSMWASVACRHFWHVCQCGINTMILSCNSLALTFVSDARRADLKDFDTRMVCRFL